MIQRRMLAVIGFPVAHSLSPEMHTAWLEEAGIPGSYRAIDVHDLGSVNLRSVMERNGLQGVNLTVPLKAAACSQVDVLDASARDAGAVNTAVLREGLLYGYNTDGRGFCRGLAHEIGAIPTDAKVVILGAGGAARGILSGLINVGVRRFCILNRTESVARQLAQEFSSRADIDVGGLTVSAFARCGEQADLVIHTTSGDGARIVTTFPVAHLSPRATWVDINYWMDLPPKMEQWSDRDGAFVTGHSMLVWQAALAFEIFTGFLPNPSPFLNHLR